MTALRYWNIRINKNKNFWGLEIGLLIVLIHVGTVYLRVNPYLDGDQFVFTPYTQWLTFNTDPWTIGYYLGLPLLCGLSASQLVGQDLQSGFFEQTVPHFGIKRYLFQTQLISFFSGALTASIPLIIDFLTLWCLLPVIQPDRIMNTNLPLLPATSFFANLYYSAPLQLVVIYISLAALIGGAYALFSTMLAWYSTNLFVRMGTGFLLTMLLNVLSGVFPERIYSPVLLIMGNSPTFLLPFRKFMLAIALVFVLIMVGNYVGGYRHESR